MRRAGVAIRGRKRGAVTRRDGRATWRRGGRRRVWMGTRTRVGAARPLFLGLSAQHMERARPADWLGAAAMLAGVASWGVLASLLGS